MARGGGYKVTFPATATNWDKQLGTQLIFADGTVKDITNYSVASGQTFENVVGINNYRTSANYYYLRMTIGKGKILIIRFIGYANRPIPEIVIPPNTTSTYYGDSRYTWFGFLEDTVISAIEMYDTD